MSSIKNPTLRRRTKELTECAEDARECQLLGYELKDLGNLIVGMAIHMHDLQRKVDSQAEHIKMLNEKLTADTPQTDCEKCEHWKYIAHEWQCETEKCQKTPQTDCGWGEPK
jgi:hypothetical protein